MGKKSRDSKNSTSNLNGGAALVLVASAFELTLERQLKEFSDDAVRSRLEETVDTIWHFFAARHTHNGMKNEEPSESQDFRAPSDVFWQPRYFTPLQRQLKWSSNLRVFTQLVSGVMILIGTLRKKDGA